MASSRNAVCDSRCQEFQKEAVRKAEKLKAVWFMRNRQRLYDNLAKAKASSKLLQELPLNKKPKFDTLLDCGRKKPPPYTLPDWRPKDKEDLSLMPPIRSSVLDILYAPRETSFVSKKNYLRERYKKNPDERFYYPQCSSWEVGWRLQDYPEPQGPEFGMKSVIMQSFYRRNASSLQRDPDWYRMCQTSDPNNFNDVLTY